MINLAVADMLAGLTVTDHFVILGAYSCNLWEDFVTAKIEVYMTILRNLFPLASVPKITAISLERLHATFWPHRHRMVKKNGSMD